MFRKTWYSILLLLIFNTAQGTLFSIKVGENYFSISAPNGTKLNDLYVYHDGFLLFNESVLLYFNNNEISGEGGMVFVLNWLAQHYHSNSVNSIIYVYEGVANSNDLSAINIYPNISTNSSMTETYVPEGTQISLNTLSGDAGTSVLQGTITPLADADGAVAESIDASVLSSHQYQCSFGCSQTFKNRIDRKLHVEEAHSSEWEKLIQKLPFRCPVCNTLITRPNLIGMHRQMHNLVSYDIFLK